MTSATIRPASDYPPGGDAFRHRHLTGIAQLTPWEISYVLDAAEEWVELNRSGARIIDDIERGSRPQGNPVINPPISISIPVWRGASGPTIDEIIEAEENEEADKEKRQLIGTRNKAEALVHATKRTLAEHSDKVSQSTVEAVELSLKNLEEAAASDDRAKMESAISNLNDASMKLGEAVYADVTDEEPKKKSADDDVIDADYEDLKDKE